MNPTNDFTESVNDLTAHWTEPVLDILVAVGLRRISIDLELDSWHVLKHVVRSELRAFRFSTPMSPSTFKSLVLRRSVELVVVRSEPSLATPKTKLQIRQLAGDRRLTAEENQLYAQIIREPRLHAAFKPASRTDLTPRLRVSAIGG